MKCKTPAGPGLHGTNETDEQKVLKTKSTKIVNFPRLPRQRHCSQCRSRYRLPWMGATIRDGRETLCPPCYVEQLKGLQ